jgi:hypothetical protein
MSSVVRCLHPTFNTELYYKCSVLITFVAIPLLLHSLPLLNRPLGLAHVSDYAEKVKGISAPEAVAGVTAHPALDKACHYLKVKLVKVPVDPATQRCVWCMSLSSSV